MAERALRFTGIISVEVDNTLLQATIVLQKGGDLDWDDAALNKVLLDAGVKEGFDRDDLVKVIFNFQRNKDVNTHREVFARGILPLPPKSEDWDWNELPIPENLKEMSARVLKTARPPEIFEIRQEKFTVEKTPEPNAKGLGLFHMAKDQTQRVTEVRDVKEKVLVDPRIEVLGYVEEGQVVALAKGAQPGKPGRDLSGKTIPPPVGQKVPFYLTSNFVKTKEGLTAQISGFLRRGKNWADIVPYRNHRWEVTFSDDKTNAFLSVYPGNPEAPRFSVKDILTFLEKEKFSRDRLMAEGEISRRIDLALSRREGFTGLSLTPSQDGVAEITISPDRLRATLTLRKATGDGTPFSLKDLGTQLKEKNIRNLDLEFVKSKINDFMKGPEIELKDFVLAQGKLPSRGGNKTLEFLVDFVTEDELKEIRNRALENPKLKSIIPHQDIFPLESVTRASVVRAGQQFAVIKPSAIKGEEGMDIFGQKVPAYPGNDPVITVLTGVRRNGEIVEAVSDGLLEVMEKDNGFFMRVRFHKDAVAEVRRSEDNMKAFLTLEQGRGTGRLLTPEIIEEALAMEQVLEGIDRDAIKAAMDAAQRGQRIEDALIARGMPPGGDLSQRLTFLISMKKSPNGQILSGAAEVSVPLAEYLPPDGQSSDGKDIMGNVIPSQDNVITFLKLGDHLKAIPKEGSTLQVIMVEKPGELIFDGKALNLKDRLLLNDGVNARTGNVKFSGTVIIEGLVEKGCYIMAGGDLKITGQVHGALLSSDGNIQISEGVRGDGKAVLRAKKQIILGFIEKSVVLPVGDFFAYKSILNCQVKCNGKVIQKSENGSIIGGHIKSKFGVDAFNLGHPSGAPTVISFGQDYLIQDQIEAEEKETEKLRMSILKIDEMMKGLTRPEDGPKLAGARQQKVLMLKLLEKRNLKLINLRDKFEAHFPSEIIIRGIVFPGVAIESHGRLFEVKAKKGKLKLVFDLQTGHIVEKPLEN